MGFEQAIFAQSTVLLQWLQARHSRQPCTFRDHYAASTAVAAPPIENASPNITLPVKEPLAEMGPPMHAVTDLYAICRQMQSHVAQLRERIAVVEGTVSDLKRLVKMDEKEGSDSDMNSVP